MMEAFSTFDVSNIFRIERTRLQEWLNREFFVPHQKAEGKGTKTIFTRDDLYRLRLFIWLLDVVKGRDTAMTYSGIQFKNVGPEKDKFKYAVWKVEVLEGGDLRFLMAKPELLKEEPTVMTKGTIFALSINLVVVKAEVDRLIEDAKKAAK